VAYVPAAQLVQSEKEAAEVVVENFPAGQSRQAAGDVPPVDAAYLPAPHDVQVSVPLTACVHVRSDEKVDMGHD